MASCFHSKCSYVSAAHPVVQPELGSSQSTNLHMSQPAPGSLPLSVPHSYSHQAWWHGRGVEQQTGSVLDPGSPLPSSVTLSNLFSLSEL